MVHLQPYLQTIFFRFPKFNLFLILTIFLFVFINKGPYVSDIFKTLLLPQLWFFYNQTFSQKFPMIVLTKLLLSILKF